MAKKLLMIGVFSVFCSLSTFGQLYPQGSAQRPSPVHIPPSVIFPPSGGVDGRSNLGEGSTPPPYPKFPRIVVPPPIIVERNGVVIEQPYPGPGGSTPPQYPKFPPVVGRNIPPPIYFPPGEATVGESSPQSGPAHIRG